MAWSRGSFSSLSLRPGDTGPSTRQWSGLDGLVLEGEELVQESIWEFGLKGSKVVTVPQFKPLCCLLVLFRGTQGS